MQYFNPALLHKRAADAPAQPSSIENDQFGAFDRLSDDYGMTNAVDDISNWWGGQGDKSAAAGNRALTYFTPRLVGSLGLAAVVSLLAGRKGGIMPALIGAVAGWFLGGPAMDFFRKTFGSKPEDVTKRTEEAKKGNSVEEADGDNKSKPYTPKNIAGGNEQPQQSQQPAPQQPAPQPQPEQPAPQSQPQPQQPEQLAEDPQGPVQQEPIPQEPIPQEPIPQEPVQPADIPQEQPFDEDELIRAQGGEIPTTGGNPVEDPAAYGLSEDAPASGMTQRPATGQPAEDSTAGEAPNMMGQIKGNLEAAVGGMKQAGGKLLDKIRGKQQPTSRPQNPTEARAQTQQTQQPQMTAEEWQQQVVGRMRIPGMPMKTPEMQLHEYAYSIPEKTAPSYSYLGLSRKPSQEELAQAYPKDMVREYATSTPFGRYKSPDELRQEMYSNDQRGLMAGRKPQGRPLQGDAPAGKFTLERNAVYNDLLRQYRGQPKIGPYKQQ